MHRQIPPSRPVHRSLDHTRATLECLETRRLLSGVPQVRLPAFGTPVEAYWQTHPYNPSSPTYIPVGAIESPANRVHLASGQSIQAAIDAMGPAGGTIILAPGGTYAGFSIFAKSNIHIISEDPVNRPTIVGQVRLAVHQLAAQLPGYDGYAAFDLGLKNNDPFFWDLFRNPTRNFYFKNVIFDGGNSVLHNNLHHVQDVLFDNVRMQNFRYPSQAEKHHRGTWNGNEGLDNIFWRNCQFASSEQYIFYLDGAHVSGVIGSTIDASHFDGGPLFLTNDDFSEDVDGDGVIEWQEQRNAKYNVVANNTVYASGTDRVLYDFVAVTGEHTLVQGNTLDGIFLNTLVQWDTRSASGRPTLIYDFTGTRVLNNTGGSFSSSYMALNHIGRLAAVGPSNGWPTFGGYQVGNNTLASLGDSKPIVNEIPHEGTIYGPNYVWNTTIGSTFIPGTPPPGNLPPLVHAGDDLVITLDQPALLDATVHDDGKPIDQPLVVQWSVVDGPGSVNFVDPLAPDTQATFSATGIYILRLTAFDGEFWQSDDVQVLVTNPVASAPVITPGSGTFDQPVDVTITSATPGAQIRYTLDGTEPTADSPVYTGAIRLTGSTTVKAGALAPGMDPSPVTSAKLAFSHFPNLLANGDMNADADANNYPDVWSSRPGVARDTAIRRGPAGASLRKSYVEDQLNAIYVYQNVNLQAGVTYTLRAWVKTSADFAGSASVRYAIVSGGAGTFNSSSITSAGTDWTELKVTFTPSMNVSGRVDLNYNITAGSVWFEDVALTGPGQADNVAPQVRAFAIDDGTAQRSSIRRFAATFSEDLVGALSVDDLVIVNQHTGGQVPAEAMTMSYDPATRTAVWSLAGLPGGLANGRYTAVLKAGGITDVAGNGLDGGDYVVSFHRLLADANGDARITSTDLAIWQQNYDPIGANAASNGPATGDWNLDGKVNSADLALWQQSRPIVLV